MILILLMMNYGPETYTIFSYGTIHQRGGGGSPIGRRGKKSIVVAQNPLSFVVWGAQSERVVLEEVSFYLDLFFLISWTPSFFSLYKLSAFLSPLFSSSS